MATVKVTVHEARDLPIMDRTTGLADPYVVVKLNDLEYTTEIVHRSRHPVWNKVFRLDTADLLILQEDPLEVRIYDHDIISRDDIIGHTFLDCNSMVLQSNPSMSGWFPLFDTSEDGIRGEVRLTVKIKFHTAENPLAPRLPTRYVRLLPPLQDYEHCNRGDDPPSPNSTRFFSSGDTLEPLRATRMQHPSLTAEDEGILIFSVWRLDPAVYRVESVLTMVEELIVKADPEHSKLTNLRSTRTTNEARIIQLYKLSGKVRRQLARKVVEMQCNAVLGYVEEFDMESNGIIVRAYGTPCVISAVKYVKREKMGSFLLSNTQVQGGTRTMETPSGCLSPALGSFGTPHHLSTTADTYTEAMVNNNNINNSNNNNNNNNNNAGVTKGVGMPKLTLQEAALSHPNEVDNHNGGMNNIRSSVPTPLNLGSAAFENTTVPLINNESSATEPPPSQQATTGTRTNVLILTLKDLPSGMIEHIGGHISAQSVKIVAKMKSKQMISQERDAWWMELREELKANARAFYCNVILGYEEVVLYHEDVAVLSLFGTAVKLKHNMHPLRCGPEFLYRHALKRFTARKNCSPIHLFGNSLRLVDITGALGEFITCNLCHQKSVPEVLLVSCAMPQDLTYEGQPRLVQAVVSKAKSAVRGVDLALAVSQALSCIEYSLHKQLLFNLKLQRLNAVFCLRVTLCITSDAIIGTMTGTGCCLVGLPVPSPPRVEILDPSIRNHDAVVRLEDVVAQHARARRRQGKNKNTTDTQRSSPTSSVSSDHRGYENSSPGSWGGGDVFSSDSDNEQGMPGYGKCGRISDYVVKIDDEEEAEIMLGMIGELTFEDSILLTVPYVPDCANAFGSQERVVLNRRYIITKMYNGSSISTGTVNKCFAEAKRAYVQAVCRVALRRHHHPLERLRVMNFSFGLFFEPNSNAIQLRLEGCLMTSTAPRRIRLAELEERSFRECLRYVEGDPRPVPLAHNSHGGSTPLYAVPVECNNALRCSVCSARTTDVSNTSIVGGVGVGGTATCAGIGSIGIGGVNHVEKDIVHHVERSVFVKSNAPYALPFVFDRDIRPPYFWSAMEAGGSAAAALSTAAIATSTSSSSSAAAAAAALAGVVSGGYRDNWARPGMVERQWQALTSLASTAIRNLMEKTRITADVKSGVDVRHRETGMASESPGGGGGPLLHQPVRRLPTDWNAFEASEIEVIFTPLDFVAGKAIARYVGRLSQHFIREDYGVDTSSDLGVFFQRTDFEMQCMVQAMVRLMGGDALLKHRVTYHEVWDSDGSGCASVFVTVTGDVVQTSTVPLVPLLSKKGDNNVNGGNN